MPYIQKAYRKNLSRIVNEFDQTITNAGELNYTITCLIFEYFKQNGNNYQAINDVVGALEGAKLEFYRRVAAPYEDEKIQQNRDVY